MCSNQVNKLCYRLKNLEELVDALLLQPNYTTSFQLNEEGSLELLSETNIPPSFFYDSSNNKQLFNIDINTHSTHKVLKINVSASFIISDGDRGSVIMKLKINNTVVTENESIVVTDGYSHLTLNYVNNIESDSLYTIEVNFEGLVISSIALGTNPILSTRNDGASLSILVI